MKIEEDNPLSPSRRVILLGASNLTRGISTVVEIAKTKWGTPLDIMSALGHGRSYGKTQRVLGRTLPAIIECGLWQDLDERPQADTASLITDVGNDLLFGVPPLRVVEWIDQCLERLASVSQSLVITELPLNNLSKLSASRFRLFRTILFPSCPMTLLETGKAAEDLNDGLLKLANRYGAQVVRPDEAWYGFDPIHIKMRHWPMAWAQIMQPWSQQPLAVPAKGSFFRWLWLRRLTPHYRQILGFDQRKNQPVARFADGSQISLY
ncbi:MAG: hypothetical protein VX346_09300 [Planctomycetota bacterium]|nr:hypothetical protein [Planctomycetota bacterium]